MMATVSVPAFAGWAGRMDANVQKLTPDTCDEETGYGNFWSDSAHAHPCIVAGNCDSDPTNGVWPGDYQDEDDNYKVVNAHVDSEGNVYVIGEFDGSPGYLDRLGYSAESDFGIWKFDINGDLDTGFGTNGLLRETGYAMAGRGTTTGNCSTSTSSDRYDSHMSVLVSDDELLVAVQRKSDCRAEFWMLDTSDGSLDTTWGSSGRLFLQVPAAVQTAVDHYADLTPSFVLPYDGDFYVAYMAKTQTTGGFRRGMLKVTGAGAIDSSWGLGGGAYLGSGDQLLGGIGSDRDWETNDGVRSA
jgi:hypothetical protein